MISLIFNGDGTICKTRSNKKLKRLYTSKKVELVGSKSNEEGEGIFSFIKIKGSSLFDKY